MLGKVAFTKYSGFGVFAKGLLSFLMSLIMLLLYVVALFFVMKKLSPKYLDKVSSFNLTHLLISLGIGLGMAILVPLAIILLFLSKIGALLALLILSIYILLIFLSIPTVLFMIARLVKNTIGDKLLKKSKINLSEKLLEYLYILDTTIVFAILLLIPFVNTILIGLFVLIGTGNLLLKNFIKE